MERTPQPATPRRRFAIAAAFALAGLLAVACQQDDVPVAATAPPVVAPAPPVPPDPEPAPQPMAVASVQFAHTPCADLAAIRNPPTLVGPPVDDPAYTAIRQEADAAVPCLVEAMTSTQPLDTPQKIPGKSDDFTVGDLAFFLLVDFGAVDFAQALPPDVSQATLTRGPFAFFDWIVQPGNRERLQARVRAQVDARRAQGRVAMGG